MIAQPGRKELDSTTALAATPSSQALLYCLRETGQLACATLREPARIVAGKDSEKLPIHLEAPYGLTWDANKRCLWVADKSANVLISIPIEYICTQDFKTTEQIHRFPVPDGTRCPCQLDWDPEFGILVGCYGISSSPGAVLRFNQSVWTSLTPLDFKHRVTHCCWLPGGGYCFVTRRDSVLWYAESQYVAPRPLTHPGNERILSADQGVLKTLRLRYVQGMYFSRRRNRLLVGDASLGAIYELDLNRKEYCLLAGRPALSDSNSRAQLKPGSADVWLGAIRSLSEDAHSAPVWLDGEDGGIWRLDNGKIEELGSALPDGVRVAVKGCGMVLCDGLNS